LIIEVPKEVAIQNATVALDALKTSVVLWPDIESALVGAFIMYRSNLTNPFEPLPENTRKLLYALVVGAYGMPFAVGLWKELRTGFLYSILLKLRWIFRQFAKERGDKGLLPSGEGAVVSPFLGGKLHKKYQKIRISL
jgi:hypothetical protein